MRYISECYRNEGLPGEAMKWARRALAELSTHRENWYACEKAAYYLNDWRGVVYYGELAESINIRSQTCINEAEAWGAPLYDLLCVGYWKTGQPEKSLIAAERAIELDGNDERIRLNVEFLKGAVSA